MNNFWSTKVQSTQLLYYSRVEKFNDENREIYFNLLGVKDGMKVLEVGCGGGHFCNMIKKYFPNCKVIGTDIDDKHIEFAKNMAKRLKLDVEYQVADVQNLPFKEGTFDLVFSHTVVEHVDYDKFVSQQKRVLKKGGRLVIMKVNTKDEKTDFPFMQLEEEVNACYAKLKIPQCPNVGTYSQSPNLMMQRLAGYGFKNIGVSFDRVVYYNPDSAGTRAIAKKQIERNYQTKLYNALFNLQLAKNGENFREELVDLLTKQRDARLELLKEGKMIFDMQSSNMITVFATK